MKTNNTTFSPANKIEVLLTTIPKRCNCNMCQEMKSVAKKELGENEYIKLCKTIGLVA